MTPRMTRRAVLGACGLAALAVAGVAVGDEVVGRAHRAMLDEGPPGVIPDAPEGQVRREQLRSIARGREVGLWTAVPYGHGDGAGLPVCLVLHGASATTADYDRFGFARFLTAAVQDGVPPFVLAGADGGRSRWD